MDIQNLIERLRKGEPRAIARALTLIENAQNDSPEARELLSEVFADGRSAKIVGLTGPPGVGKSTLVDVLAKLAREHDRDVAVLAVDPTSPFTGGALLGDRARMDSGTADPNVFIRSMATRGHVGGLSATVFEALVVLEAAGKDFIFVETVGAGQDEVEVAAAVDVTSTKRSAEMRPLRTPSEKSTGRTKRRSLTPGRRRPMFSSGSIFWARVHGAWSVASMSIRPSRSPCHIASTSAAGRSGGCPT